MDLSGDFLLDDFIVEAVECVNTSQNRNAVASGAHQENRRGKARTRRCRVTGSDFFSIVALANQPAQIRYSLAIQFMELNDGRNHAK